MSKGTYQKIEPGKCRSILNGQVKLSDFEGFTNSSQVNGQFLAQKATFPHALEINGQSKCQGCTFKGSALFCGDTFFTECNFQNDLEVLNNQLELSGCKAANVYLTLPRRFFLNLFAKPKVFLRNGTVVQSISFSVTGGVVYCFDESNVLEVRNGSVIKK